MSTKDSSKFVLLNLDDEHTKDVANAVSSKSGKKILGYLEKHEKVTESELSKELTIPMSTVNYTIEQLSKANLIENSHYHFSSKGREVKHWKLANKLIIIAPKKTEGLYDKIKDLLGIFFLTGIGSIFYSYFNSSSFNSIDTATILSEPITTKSYAYEQESAIMTDSSFVNETIITSEPNIALWFFIGVCFTLLLIFLLRIYKKR